MYVHKYHEGVQICIMYVHKYCEVIFGLWGMSPQCLHPNSSTYHMFWTVKQGNKNYYPTSHADRTIMAQLRHNYADIMQYIYLHPCTFTLLSHTLYMLKYLHKEYHDMPGLTDYYFFNVDTITVTSSLVM